MDILKLLTEIENILIKNNAFVLKHLNKGISFEYFKDKLSYYNFNNINNEIITLYNWHNGINIPKNGEALKYRFFGNYYLNSIDDLISIIRFDDFYNFHKKKFMPLFSNGTGEYLVVDCNATCVRYCGTWLPELPPYIIIYDNVESMLQTVLNCYKEKALFFDLNGCVQINFKLAHSISKSLNPNSEFWTIE